MIQRREELMSLPKELRQESSITGGSSMLAIARSFPLLHRGILAPLRTCVR